MRFIIGALLSLTTLAVSANNFQYITGISYSNPAELFKIKSTELILGGTTSYLRGEFSGYALNFNTFTHDYGTSDTSCVSVLPYGRIAGRFDKKMVFAVNVTQPFHSNLRWGRNAVSRYAATETLMTDIDVSPRFSFSVTPKLYAGAGINFNFLENNETNWALPSGPSSYATLINRTASFGVGYNGGLYYIINQTNFIGAVYYSSIRQATHGQSYFNGAVNNNISFNFNYPATTVLSYAHLFSPEWAASVQVFRSEWNINQNARLRNTAAPAPLSPDFTFPTHYKESWAYNAGVRHQVSEKLGMTLVGMIDNGPERDNLRTINFPSDTQYFLGIIGDYHLTKSSSIEVLYGHGFSKTLVNNFVQLGDRALPFTAGRIHLNADVLDIKLKVQM